MTDKRELRTWAEVDLDALAHNYRALRAMLPQGCRFLGLVKADAYGHGAVPVARKLQALGADMLAVACVAEGAELRRAGVTLPILCLGQTPAELADDLLTYGLTQTVEDLDTGRALSAAAGDDPEVQQRLADAIAPGHILFYGDRLEIDFPAGAFAGLDATYTLTVEYARLEGILDPRALPGGQGAASQPG